MSNIPAAKLADLRAYVGRKFINRDGSEHKLLKINKGKIKVSDIEQNIPELDFRKEYTLIVNV